MRRGGEFATSRRGLSEHDVHFILARNADGYGRQNIAKMVGCAFDDVDRVLSDIHVPLRRPTRKPPKLKEPTVRQVAPLVAANPDPMAPLASEKTLSIIGEVAAEHGLTLGHLLGPQRARHISIVRHKAYYEVRRQRPHLSYPSIGKAFRRDHSTVVHGVQQHEARMAWVECLIAAADCYQPDLFARAA